VLYGECLGGALYRKDFERIAGKAGFIDPRVVLKRVVDISNEEIKKLVENITFHSITYRLWESCGAIKSPEQSSGNRESSPCC